MASPSNRVPAYRRAVHPEQQAERRRAILRAAASLVLERDYESVRLADVGTAVGLTKAALYRYYSTKEALFLALFLDALDHLDADLAEVCAETAGADGLPRRLARLFAGHPLYCKLASLLHGVLERSLDMEAARAFKADLMARLERMAARLAPVTGLGEAEAQGFLLNVQQALIGCWSMADPPPVLDTLLQEPDFAALQVRLEPALARHIRALLRDWRTLGA